MPQTWQELVADKKERQLASIPKEWILKNLPSEHELNIISFPEACGLLSAKEVEITNSSVDVLLGRLASAQWTSFEVTTAFSKRAVIAHQLTNCLTEIFFDRALKRASELDEYLKTTGKTVGPLHGLPVSLKDQISLKGIESTMGYVSWIGKYPERNSVLVDVLESLGAVLYVKTNVPQTLMWPETFNHVFGRTLNPHNRSLTPGGSSGGEGALIALKGAPIGVGSDIGGSVRIPSSMNGIYGFRPSGGRVPYAGSVNSEEGQDSLPSVFGPMSNSISGIKVFMQGVMSQKSWLRDPLVIRKKWDNDEYCLAEHGGGKGLCFAILWNDGQIIPHPPITRGLEITKEALLAAGHRVIDWKPIKHKEIIKAAFDIFGAGLEKDFAVTTASTKEPRVSHMGLDQDLSLSEHKLIPATGDVSAYDLWQVHKKRRDLRQEYLEHWMATESQTGTGRPVDAIIAPVAPFAAPPHGKYSSIHYTVIWNALDYPALVIPVSKVDQTLDTEKPAHEFLSDADEEIYELYDPNTFKDAPVCVQVVGRNQEDEAVVGMAEIVDAALKAEAKSHL